MTLRNTTFVDLVLPPFLGASGYRYDVTLDGETIVRRSKSPLTDAARALVSKGIAGRIVLRHAGIGTQGGLIAVLATLTASEGDRSAPRFVKWTPNPHAEALP